MYSIAFDVINQDTRNEYPGTLTLSIKCFILLNLVYKYSLQYVICENLR